MSEPSVADARPDFDVADLDIAWVPGPAGGLRVAQGPAHDSSATLVVYLHGLGGGLEQWAPCLRSAGARVRPVAFDLPGHGGSDPLEAPTLDLLAASLGAVVDHLGARRVVLVGHSLGASVALRWASQRPDRVVGLLLVDPSGDQTRLPASARETVLEAMAADAHEELMSPYRQLLRASSAEVTDLVLSQLSGTSAEVLHRVLAAAFNASPTRDLERYRAAGGLVRAMLSAFNDAPISLHRLMPDLEVAWVEGAGHWLMLDTPEIFMELQSRFLADCAPRL